MNYILFILMFGIPTFVVVKCIKGMDKEINMMICKAAEVSYTKGCYNGVLAGKNYKKFLTNKEIQKCKSDSAIYLEVLKRPSSN